MVQRIPGARDHIGRMVVEEAKREFGPKACGAKEYRLRWQREGQKPVVRIYQTKRAAIAKAQRVMAMDRLDLSDTQFSDMPPLVQPPILYVRECEPWRPSDEQPPDPNSAFVEGMDRWLDGWRHEYAGGPF